LVQSQVRCNRVPKKVPEKVLGIFGAKPSQIQGVPEKVPGSHGAKPSQVQRGPEKAEKKL
jgi:hypothetical protein